MTPRKVVLITDSATGVGRGCALRFAKRGFAVAVNYSKSREDAERTLSDVKALGVPALVHQTTVADDAGSARQRGRPRPD